MVDPRINSLDAVGRIATYAGDIADLERRLNRIPLWQSGKALIRQAVEANRMIDGIQERLDGRLVVTLIGPSGAGKSTLFNALSGRDDLSPTGIQRPTTRGLVVLADDPQSAKSLLAPLDDDRFTLCPGPAAGQLEHLILVDTPDTDSLQSPAHLDLLVRVISRSDVLVCVFDAQNPKRRDHADFMAPLVQKFNGGSLVAVVNKCDRHDAGELGEIIGPDFDGYLQETWPIRPEALLMISARSHLKDPQWDPDAQPMHALDQFDQLRRLIMETLNRPNAGTDRRIANAARIRDYVMEKAYETAARHKPYLEEAAEKMAAAEQEAMQAAIALLQADDRRQMFGIGVRLYQALAQRWMGPVGWLVAVWSRLMVFGGGLAALVRLGHPVRQLWGAVSARRGHKEGHTGLGMLGDGDRVDTALNSFRRTLLTRWPDIAEALVKGGFHSEIRELAANTGDEVVGQALDRLWSDVLDRQINRYANRLSHLLLQLLFNLPVVAILGYAGWLTASGFFTRHYLSTGFFLHATLTIAIALLLSFFLLQAMVRLVAGKNRIRRRAFQIMEKEAGQRPILASRDVAQQVDRILNLARQKPEDPRAGVVEGLQ
jgi:GTPase SAR1 family protein